MQMEEIVDKFNFFLRELFSMNLMIESSSSLS